MRADHQPVQSIVVVGGGTAGWMAAASLIHRLGPMGVAVTVVESSAIGTIGVGEATVPAIRRYFSSLGLDTFELMKACNATFKLAIEFDGWLKPGHSFMHPFGRYGVAAGPLSFHHLWQRLAQAGEVEEASKVGPLGDYSLGDAMARAGRFALPDAQPPADFAFYDWAIHFDASLFARYLRGFSEARGVKRIDGRIVEVRRAANSGFIEAVRLENGDEVGGDLFVDCSGFRGLLIGEALGVPFVNWRKWLLCDRAVALPCAHADAEDLTPYTRSRAEVAGWTWRIPLQHRVGNGYVYSSEHISDEAAEAVLRAGLDGAAMAEANRVRFTAGHRARLWEKNCVAIGLAGGFLEPLESTSITLIQAGIDKLLTFFPDKRCDARLSGEYNRISVLEYERIRDFIILHYWGNRRDGAFWRHCRQMELPDSLVHRIELYRASGKIAQMEWDSFFEPSWVCLLNGLDVVPEAYDPFADQYALEDVQDLGRNVRADVQRMAMDAPLHAEFIRKHCRAE